MTRLAGPDVATLLEGLPLAPALEGPGEARVIPARAPSKRPARAPAPKRPPGRPSTLTPALTRKLCRSLRAGLTYGQACRLVRLPRRTFYAWLAKGEDDRDDDLDTPHAAFACAIRQAAALFAHDLLGVLNQRGPNGRVPGRVAMRLLERRFPEHYALGATRRRAQRLAAQRDIKRAVRRGQPLDASWFELFYDALGPADVERFVRLSRAPRLGRTEG